MSSLPRRYSRSLVVTSLRVVAVLVLGVAGLAMAGCPGDLDPRLLGPTGTAGTGGPQVCDGAALMVSKCGQAGCHNSNAPQAGLDLVSAGVISRLLGQPGNTTANPVCSGNTKALLVQGSTSGDGFLIDKLISPPPCGTIMPQIPGPLSAADLQCMKDWATAVTTGQLQ